MGNKGVEPQTSMQMRQRVAWPGQLLTSLRRGKTYFFPLKYFYGNFGEIPPFTEETTSNNMSQKEGEKTGIHFIEVWGMRGRYFGRGRGQRKNYTLMS